MKRYTIYILPSAWKEIKRTPGHIRQRIKRAINTLSEQPRPPESKALDMSAWPEIEAEIEVRRIRLDRWRIVYILSEEDQIIDILAIRKRPPYDYGDLERLLEEWL